MLEAEIERLDTVDRPRAIKDVSEAVQKGDLSENAEYQEARARLSRTEARILRLREKRKRVEVIQKSPKNTNIVAIGSSVRLDSVRGISVYTVVGSEETDPSRGFISYKSPLGTALVGKRTGDRVSVKTKNNDIEYKIVSIE